MGAKIGFATDYEGGTGLFLSRLRDALRAMDRFDADAPDIWVQPALSALPSWVAERRGQGKTRVVLRMDAPHCARHFYFDKGVVIPVPFLDNFESRRTNRRKNARMIENLGHADDLVYQSEFGRRLVQHFVRETDPGKLIFNAVPLDVFTPEGTRARLGSPDTVKILVTHRFRPAHRLHEAMRVLAQLKFFDSKPPYHLFILGEDVAGAFDYARQVAAGEKLEENIDYTFLGPVPAESMPDYYRAADILLNLSYWDTCPNTVIEAMACGLPVAGVRHGGLRELLGRDGGILVEEPIPFTWHAHHDFRRMPAISAADYANAVMKLCSAGDAWRRSAREAAEERFDIRTAAAHYALVADKL